MERKGRARAAREERVALDERSQRVDRVSGTPVNGPLGVRGVK